MWALLAVLSAFFLGFYDICKKRSLNNNSVIGVLTCSIVISAIVLSPLLLTNGFPTADGVAHVRILIKSILVLTSWLCGYIALKHLPISIVSPMQASRPMWTLLGALLIFHESLNLWQWAGVICTLGSVFAFSFSIKRGKQDARGQGRFYIFLVLAILTGAMCGLYDKHVMRMYDHRLVQVWYTIYQAGMMLIVCAVDYVIQKRKEHPIATFHWSWAIVGISVFLILSDYTYLLALRNPDSLIAVVSTIRRAGTVIPFLYGIIILKEKQIGTKVACLCGILLGLLCLLMGSL